MKQFMASDAPKLYPPTLHIVINMIGLTVVPFLMAPVLRKVGKLDQQQFMALLQERKALIPKWLSAMVKKGPQIK